MSSDKPERTGRTVLGVGPSIFLAVVFISGFATNFFDRKSKLFWLLPLQLTLTIVILPAYLILSHQGPML